ncbi:uncharacterized protein METZ01_LOCUS427578, partial [marine metagenome]
MSPVPSPHKKLFPLRWFGTLRAHANIFHNFHDLDPNG